MKKSKAIRLAGFVGALCASGALLGTAVSGTGAYFSESHDGAINTSIGDVKVSTSDLALNYENLLPGSYKTQSFHYTATGTGPEDIWLVIPDTGADALGTSGSSSALGRYGHFQLDSNAGSFVSNNLAGGQDQCPVDANGHGGSNAESTFLHQGDASPNDPSTMPYCAVPKAVLLDSNVTNGHGGDATITFGFTKVLRSGQDAPLAQLAKFKIVATQAGIRPDDTANPAGTNG